MMEKEITSDLRVGPYILLEEIGSGSTGTVWKAKHEKTQFEVAIKIVSKITISSPRRATRFMREIEMLKVVEHPFIVDFYQHIEDENNHYLVMEYVPKGSLALYIEENGALPEQLAIKFFIQIFSVLEYLHKTAHIAHRDLKAENILIDNNFNIRVIDFGLSKEFTTEDYKFSTVCGSRSPEIYKGEQYSAKADIWAFGVITYLMSVGNLPFYEENTQKIMNKVLFSPPTFPEDFPTELIDLISRMLSKFPDQRITLDDIKCHAYFSPREYNNITPYIVNFMTFTFSPQDIADCEEYGVTPSALRQSLTTRQFNEETAVSRIIKRRKLNNEISGIKNRIRRKRSDSLNKRKEVPSKIKCTSPAPIIKHIVSPPINIEPHLEEKPHRRAIRGRMKGENERSRAFTLKIVPPNFF